MLKQKLFFIFLRLATPLVAKIDLTLFSIEKAVKTIIDQEAPTAQVGVVVIRLNDQSLLLQHKEFVKSMEI